MAFPRLLGQTPRRPSLHHRLLAHYLPNPSSNPNFPLLNHHSPRFHTASPPAYGTLPPPCTSPSSSPLTTKSTASRPRSRPLTPTSRNKAYDSEIVVVENGSQDLTAVVTEAFAADHPRVRLLRETGRGKGLAVRRGMLESAGAYRFICDADLSMPIDELSKFLPPAVTGCDVAIGSREVAGSRRFNEPRYRHFQGRVFSNLVKLFALPGFEDTQCGFKCFSAAAARDVFSVQVFDGMSFDVEVLYIAVQRGYCVLGNPHRLVLPRRKPCQPHR